jgi:hypothetical protein
LLAVSTPVDAANRLRDSFHRERPDPIADYVRMRRAVLNRGIEALPAASPAPSTYDEPLTREHMGGISSST